MHERTDPAHTDARLTELAASLSVELEQASVEIPDAEEVPTRLDAGAVASGAGEQPPAGVTPAPGAMPPGTLQPAPIALPPASPAIPQLGLSI